ncbi:MAG: MBL fold metallo-hydrolase [Candidatus Thermoplasmatota archaeon]
MHVNRTSGSARISARDLKKRLDEGRPLLLLDVRSPEEFRDWRLPNAVNLPLPRLLAGEQPLAPPGAEIVTVCLHGARSEKAREALSKAGHRVLSLEGGMVAWNTVYDVATIPSGVARVRQLRRVGKGCMGYVVANGGEAIVIDPTMDIDAYLEEAERSDARIVKVLDTHAHADHVSGSRRLAASTGAEYLAPEELGSVVRSHVRDGGMIEVGAARVRVLASPGHTPGSVTYLLDDLAFTGDTLFVESVGRPDLGQDPRPNARVLWRTLHERIFALPGRTRVLSAHFGESIHLEPGRPISATLDELRGRLPALSMAEPEFEDWVARNALPKPGNFETIKRYNLGLVEVDLEDLQDLEAGPNRCSVA